MVKINTFGNVKTQYMRKVAKDIDQTTGDVIYETKEANGVVLSKTDGTEYTHEVDKVENGRVYFTHNDIEFYFDTHSKATGQPVCEVVEEVKEKPKKEAK